MIPTAIPNLGGNEAKYLQECITTTFVSTAGPFISRFEDALCVASASKYCAALSSGTAALHLALTASGVESGDLVISPSLTFIASANAISHAGAHPWLFDVGADTWTLDLLQCESKLETETEMRDGHCYHLKTGRRVSAIMPVLIMGNRVDIVATKKLALRFGLRVIIDAAAAIGACFDGLLLGQMGADAICFSFNGNKTITCGGGGAIVSNNKALVARAAHLASTARTSRDYDHDEIGYNLRITNLEAAVGLAQIEQLPTFLKAKKKTAATYSNFAQHYNMLGAFPLAQSDNSTHWFSGFWYTGIDLDCPARFREYCENNGIHLRSFWKPVHLQLPYVTCLHEEMTITDDLWRRIFTLPCSTHLPEADLAHVLEVSHNFWGENQ